MSGDKGRPVTPHPSAPAVNQQMTTAGAAESVAAMVVEWVEMGIKGGADWREGLPILIARRLARFAPAVPVGDGWVKVSERLPDIARAVNVYCDGADAAGVAWRCPDDSWFIPEPQAIGYESITHWQPLPAAPAATKEG